MNPNRTPARLDARARREAARLEAEAARVAFALPVATYAQAARTMAAIDDSGTWAELEAEALEAEALDVRAYAPAWAGPV